MYKLPALFNHFKVKKKVNFKKTSRSNPKKCFFRCVPLISEIISRGKKTSYAQPGGSKRVEP